MPCKATTKEYGVRENETVGELRERVAKDISWWACTTALLQDGRELSGAVTLREVDVQQPLVYARW